MIHESRGWVEALRPEGGDMLEGLVEMALGEELVEGGVLVGVEALEAEGSCGFGPEVVVGWG